MTDESPLTEVNPDSLEDLFSTSPLERKPEEWKLVVESLRAQRAKWAQQEAAGTKLSKAKAKAVPKALINLDDDDFSE
jgi:hypothetical protein